jgi:hypothetical protein
VLRKTRAYSGGVTDKPRDTGLRDAFVGILMTVGPFFGVRYRPPRVEIPVVTTPANEGDVGSGGAASASDRSAEPADHQADDGIVV